MGWGWGWWEKDQRLVTSPRWDLGPGSVQWGSVSVRQRHLGPAWSTVAHRWPLTARPAHRWRRVRPLSIRAHSDAFQEMMELPLCFQNLNLDDQFLIFLIFLIFGVVTGNIQIGSVQQQQGEYSAGFLPPGIHCQPFLSTNPATRETIIMGKFIRAFPICIFISPTAADGFNAAIPAPNLMLIKSH